MEKEQYAKGDRVYIKGSFPGRCSNVFVTLDRKGETEGLWYVDHADRIHPVHESYFEFKAIPSVPGKPRFKRGDRVLSKCPGHATFNKKGTILEESPDAHVGELYQIRLDDGAVHRLNLGWLLPVPKELPDPKFKKGDKVDYDNGPIKITGTVVGISCYSNEVGEYVYLIQDTDGRKRWSSEAFTTLAKKPDSFKDQLQPGDRVKLKYNRNCGTVVGLETAPGFIERYRVKWDKSGKTYTESRRSLEVLYAPRSTDDPLPAQAEIDAIDKLREPLIKQVEELQAKLRVLNQAKAKFKQF